MQCEDGRQKTEKYIIVIEMRINENERESVFSFTECGMDRQRSRGLNVRIISILFVLVHLYLFKEGTQRVREEQKK